MIDKVERPSHARKPGAGKGPRRAPGPAKKGGRPGPSRADDTGGKRTLRRPPKTSSPAAADAKAETAAMRIAKVMARAGLCSRRDAEAWIEEGRVTVNGAVLKSPATNVGAEDIVTVDGEVLAPRERTRLFLFHKPRGLVTTDKDPEGRQTIFDYLRESWPDGPRVISIGRLDINTEGLLLLTNDGGLARVLELPSTGWTRRYRVRANGKTDQAVLDRLRSGVTVDGIDYAGIEASLDRVQGDNVWLSLSLREGKNREIKRVLENIGLYVNRLIRVSFGPFQLGELAEGAVEEVRTRVLKDQLGEALAEEADADFDSPIAEQKTAAPPEVRGRPRRDGAEPKIRGRETGSRDTRGRETRDREPRGRERERTETRKISPSRAAKIARDAKSGAGAARSGSRDGRSERREAPAPVEPSFKPRGPRKHISAMRASDATAKQGERKRSFHSETADCKGRAVIVERIAPAVERRESRKERPEEAPRERRGERQDRPRGFKSAAVGKTASEERKSNRASRGASFKTSDKRPSGKSSFAGKAASAKPAPGRRPDGTQAHKPVEQRARTSRPSAPKSGGKPGGASGRPSRKR